MIHSGWQSAMNDFRCISIETSTQRGSVGICVGDEERIVEIGEAQASSRAVFRIVDELLQGFNLTPAELDAVACGCGPGSFTGVRVAVSAAQGLAFASEVPVVTVSSLALVAGAAAAGNAAGDDAQRYAVCLDARMGEAYFGLYGLDVDSLPYAEQHDALVDPGSFRLAVVAPDAVPVGAGWSLWPELLEGLEFTDTSEVFPAAGELLRQARSLYARGQTCDAQSALPNYVRNQVTQ